MSQLSPSDREGTGAPCPSNLRKTAGYSLTLLGATLFVAGVLAIVSARGYGIRSGDFKWIAGEVLIILGLVLLPAGLKLATGKVIVPKSDRSRIAIGCYVAGIGILVCSLFPISLAVKDPDFRWLCMATSLGAILIGLGFIFVGRKIARGTSKLPWYCRSL